MAYRMLVLYTLFACNQCCTLNGSCGHILNLKCGAQPIKLSNFATEISYNKLFIEWATGEVCVRHEGLLNNQLRLLNC
jgi:hypothetical protein